MSVIVEEDRYFYSEFVVVNCYTAAVPPIDAVFLWVDGNTPEQREARAYWSSQECSGFADATAEYRFADHKELQYALRSFAQYAEWIRTIHIVTNGQVPEWLDIHHPKIHLVTHEELFPDPSVLPTFNSHAIELFLDRIPGLAEHFLACNDDFLLNAPLHPEDVFTQDGKAKVFIDSEWLPQPDAALHATWEIALANAQALLNTLSAPACYKRLAHVLRPLQKSVCRECRIHFDDAIHRASTKRFRSPEDISFAWCLAPYYSLLQGKAVTAVSNGHCVTVTNDTEAVVRQLSNALAGRYQFLCINDATHDATDVWDRVCALLEQKYPMPSPYEKLMHTV